MKKTHWLYSGLLLAGIVLSACSGLNTGKIEPAATDSMTTRLMAQSVPRLKPGTSTPGFVVDASWPKPLPNNWTIGQIGGLSVDSDDNIWVYHRGRSVAESFAFGLGIAGTDSLGNPVDGLGNSRSLAPQIAGCCSIAPSVLKFDPEGNLLTAWGGPQDPGFLQNQCRPDEGCIWPAVEHGIYVDHNNFVYITGNGPGSSAEFPWAATHGADSHILKFTAQGEFIYQIGYAGAQGADSQDRDSGPNDTPQPYRVADMMVDPDTNRMYIADGYGNHRVLIVDAATGKYIGHFGAYGQNPVDDSVSPSSSPNLVEAWAKDYRNGVTKPANFRNPVHCAKLSDDGLLYICDRGNNRIQVFDLEQAGRGECQNAQAREGLCGFIRDIPIAPFSASGTVVSIGFSSDPDQSCLYAADLANGTFYIINRENATELDRIGRPGRQAGEFHWIHALSVDSSGNIYTGEVDSGQRVQKFTRYGSDSCSGLGYQDIGAYERNR